MRIGNLQALAAALLLLAAFALPAQAQESRLWVTSWAGPAHGPGSAHDPSPEAGARDQSFRMIVKPELWGREARLRFSNALGAKPVTFADVYIGLHQASSAVLAGTSQPVSFRGRKSVTVKPGQSVWSDAVRLPFARNPKSGTLVGRKIAVSFHVPGESVPMTWHAKALQTSYLTAPGTGSKSADESEAAFPLSTASWFFLDALDMRAVAGAQAVVAFGDSITDGTLATLNGDDRWPDVLARRLRAEYGNRVSVVNAGSAGGAPALARLERDVLTLSGVSHVIWLEGLDDFNEAAMREGVARIRARLPNARVIGATLAPAPGSDEKRKQLDTFIRSSGVFDSVVDFGQAANDRQGYLAMGMAFDLGQFKPPAPKPASARKK